MHDEAATAVSGRVAAALLRGPVRLLAIAVIVVAIVVVLDFVHLLVPIASTGTASMAPTIPACDGRALAEGFTYKFRDPHHGEIVTIHATGKLGGKITPDADGRDLVLTRRVVGGPGDQVVGRNGSLFVNGVKVDDIRTTPFPQVELASDRYFVLGDNRSASNDSRTFGPVLRDAIFGRVFLVFWPLADFGLPESRRSGAPPGSIDCSS